MDQCFDEAAQGEEGDEKGLDTRLFVDGTGSVPKAQNDALDRSKSVGSTATVVRLGDIGTTFTCAQVRDALVGK